MLKETPWDYFVAGLTDGIPKHVDWNYISFGLGLICYLLVVMALLFVVVVLAMYLRHVWDNRKQKKRRKR